MKERVNRPRKGADCLVFPYFLTVLERFEPFNTMTSLRLALFEPDIPQNAGTLMRLAACLGVAVDVIEPCGFAFGEKQMRRAGMDYLDKVDLTKHMSWSAFENALVDGKGRALDKDGRGRPGGNRLVLLTTKAAQPYTDFDFKEGDIIMVGRESAGVPEAVHDAADARLLVPMVEGVRSLNVAVTASMVLGEALRQLEKFPK